MFGIGGTELLVILLIALLVLGPERLPEVTRWMAKVVRELRRAGDEVRMQLDPEMDVYRAKDVSRPPQAEIEPKKEEIKPPESPQIAAASSSPDPVAPAVEAGGETTPGTNQDNTQEPPPKT